MIKLNLPKDLGRKIDAKSVFVLYLQLKNHFNCRYDVVKYQWNMNVSDRAFHKRRDKYFFEKLSKNFNLKELCFIFICNMIGNENAWVGEISESDPLVFYRQYVTRLKNLKDNYIDDIKNIYYFKRKINLPLKEIFSYNDSCISYLFKLLQSDVISYETFVILDSFMNFVDDYDQQDNIIWENYSKRIQGYKKILTVDQDIAKKIFINTIKEVTF